MTTAALFCALLAGLLPVVLVRTPAEAAVLTGVQRVSVSAGGTQGNNNSTYSSVSDGGRWVAFSSYATNLVPGDTNGKADVFVRDTTDGTITRVSVRSDGTQGDGDSELPTISADGRYVLFGSYATNFVSPPASPLTRKFYVHYRQAGTTEIAYLAN